MNVPHQECACAEYMMDRGNYELYSRHHSLSLSLLKNRKWWKGLREEEEGYQKKGHAR